MQLDQNQPLASIWLHFPDSLLSLLCTAPINRFLQVIAFVLSCHISGGDRIELLLLSGEKKKKNPCNMSVLHLFDLYWTPILLFNWCLISHILLPFVQLRCLAWPAASSSSLPAGALSCGAAFAGTGERDTLRAQGHGTRKEDWSAGKSVWQAAGGDAPLH